MSVVCLGGGVGATRLWRALASEIGQDSMTIVVNTADDLWHYGLRVCPDLDTVIYGLSDRQDKERGWGLRDESFAAMETLAELGQDIWFNLGDRDLATHLLRTELLRQGASLSEVAAHLAVVNRLTVRILPMCDEEVGTEIHETRGEWTPFQEFHVKHRAEPEVDDVRYAGIEDATTPAAVLSAIESASLIILGPSSPIASVMPILSVGRTRAAIQASGAPVVAITPIVSGTPLIDPGEAHRARCRERLMGAQGLEHSAVAAAALYADLIDYFVLDEADEQEFAQVEALGVRAVVAPTLTHVHPTVTKELVGAIVSLSRQLTSSTAAGPLLRARL
ncbi:2-phospho-L-lactate transferase [Rhodococcus opacus]|uniref:2-phospho-L-lactate transferase n=1 Tax=Rhodococcus opacus TaxID=37919 RepID=UPI002236A433|nr:2-phospho-L-lactate transferase [Rhodococcus opacus]UZG60228.1 2-phospho-L-lactate transferase [Rhodococcus opacus]